MDDSAAIKDRIGHLYYKEKLSMRQIAKRVGKSPTTLSRWMKFWGWRPRSIAEACRIQSHNRKMAQEAHVFWCQHADEIVDMLNAGLTQKEIGQKIGRSQNAVRKAIKRLRIQQVWIRRNTW